MFTENDRKKFAGVLGKDFLVSESTDDSRLKKFNELTEKIIATTEPTNYDVDAFIRYSRGRATAEDIKTLIHEGMLDEENLTDFQKEYFFMENLINKAVAAQKISEEMSKHVAV